MIRAVLETETEELVRIAEGTKVFKPLELDNLCELLGEFHAGNCGLGHDALSFELDGQPVGFTYFAPTPMTAGTWHMYWIFVTKGIQARGIGTQLLRHVEAEITEAGGRLLLIETSGLPTYELTRQFYIKHGYEQTGIIRDFYSDGDDQVIFRKRLRN